VDRLAADSFAYSIEDSRLEDSRRAAVGYETTR
jgi:hypothetical protein